MKKLVLVLAIALIAVPAFAAVTLTGTPSGTTVTVGYDATGGALPRAFGLVLQATGGTITSVTATKTGESTSGALGYGIFPGTININDVNGHVDSYGTPVEPNALPGGPSALGTSRVVVALGSLYGPGDANKPGATGTLFTVVCSAGTTSLTVSEEETYRGGIVDVNAVGLDIASAPKVYTFTAPETITTPTVTKTTAAPAIDGRVNAVRSETFVASGAVSSNSDALEYQFTWGGDGAGAWGAATQTHTFASATTAAWTANVTVQARCIAHPTVLSAVSSPIAETGEAVKSTATTLYADWAVFNRPICWAYQRSCHGDYNGTGAGTSPLKKWVTGTDLTGFKAAYNKMNSELPAGGICADFNHTGAPATYSSTQKRVTGTDLTIFKNYYNKYENDSTYPNTPCPSTNYNFWTN